MQNGTRINLNNFLKQGATTSSGCGRGKGFCPKCQKTYANKYKPKICPKCGFEIGGFYSPKKHDAKKSIPGSTLIFSNETTQIYSVMTTTRNNRCFAIVEDGIIMCHNATCKESRSVFMNSRQPGLFTCKHSEKVQSSHQPEWKSFCTPSKVEQYSADNRHVYSRV